MLDTLFNLQLLLQELEFWKLVLEIFINLNITM